MKEVLERIAVALEKLLEFTVNQPLQKDMEEFIKLQKKHLEDHMNEGHEPQKVDG